MATCRAYEVVVVPFPFTDRRTSKRRPALALSSEEFSAGTGQTVFAMITSANNPDWMFDVLIDAACCGLPAPSKVRLKLFTLDNRLIQGKLGALSELDREKVRKAFRQAIPL
jgi:mRNA interferase MazF